MKWPVENGDTYWLTPTYAIRFVGPFEYLMEMSVSLKMFLYIFKILYQKIN